MKPRDKTKNLKKNGDTMNNRAKEFLSSLIAEISLDNYPKTKDKDIEGMLLRTEKESIHYLIAYLQKKMKGSM